MLDVFILYVFAITIAYFPICH